MNFILSIYTIKKRKHANLMRSFEIVSFCSACVGVFWRKHLYWNLNETVVKWRLLSAEPEVKCSKGSFLLSQLLNNLLNCFGFQKLLQRHQQQRRTQVLCRNSSWKMNIWIFPQEVCMGKLQFNLNFISPWTLTPTVPTKDFRVQTNVKSYLSFSTETIHCYKGFSVYLSWLWIN